MIKKAFSCCLTVLLLLVSVLANAQQQDTETGPVNEFFRSNGKIYVIVGVLVIIFLGIVLFLINLDRKIGKLEEREKNQ
ncbi:CcmD family protein [Chitinophaga vietnamensis]|uniref:CcmD family protein n=1 Tax=Chitinophaga vietnamensis TaxID=2593957 RepID=UPI001177DDD5|nr:CcmD family protein [Chitinophaga vietnamensis]